MAKILKVKYTRTKIAQDGGTLTKRTRPPEYDINKISAIAYEESENLATVEARTVDNVDYAYLIGVVKDEDAAAFLVSADIEELTQQDAETLGETYKSAETIIVDQDAVIGILAKVSADTVLTTAEKEAIDPTKETPGLSSTPGFTSILLNEITKVG